MKNLPIKYKRLAVNLCMNCSGLCYTIHKTVSIFINTLQRHETPQLQVFRVVVNITLNIIGNIKIKTYGMGVDLLKDI